MHLNSCAALWWFTRECFISLNFKYSAISIAATVHSIQTHNYFRVDFRAKARNQRCHSTLFNGFKFATSTFVLYILNVYHYSHIPQALRFLYNLSSLGTTGCLLAIQCWWGQIRSKQLSMAANILSVRFSGWNFYTFPFFPLRVWTCVLRIPYLKWFILFTVT